MIQLDQIDDKIECFEAFHFKELEKKIAEQIENNKVLLLTVRSVQHQVHIDPKTERTVYTAIVHFKGK